MLRQLAANLSERQSFSVWPVRQHRVDGVTDFDDLRPDWNLCSAQTIRIAPPILPFMVMPHRQNDIIGEGREGPKQLYSLNYMGLNYETLRRRKTRWLLNNLFVYCVDLADIVKEGGCLYLCNLTLRKS